MVTYTPCSQCIRMIASRSDYTALVERHQKHLKIPQDESEWTHLLNVWLRRNTMNQDVKDKTFTVVGSRWI
ncbi:hypothetical protein TNCT_197801 [Trichonephila clavata]|uniref:Uncharacterized protein n=1 Tax=Trichonephila clavata TaxID=2740835 RepID=A0A8X6I0C0_TRICU|nr:hypothetical protein TNCT_197801 [Trichonephila clavata]